MSLSWDALAAELRAGQKFLLTSHVRPDCDALGSELGLAAILDHLGKETVILNADATPENISFVDPKHRIQVLSKEVAVDAIPEHDVIVVLDTSAWIQLGAMADVVRNSPARKIVIDHHVSSDDLGAKEFKDTEAEATGRLITDLARHLEIQLPQETATSLFAALMTDTGWLRFSSVTGDSYRCAAELMDMGAQPSWVYGQLYEREQLERNRLWSRILERLSLDASGRLVHTYVRNQDFEETNAKRTDTDDAVNQGLRIEGTEAAFFIVEQPTGEYKVSFRSRGPVDCSQVAEQFGGGGHRAAAGAIVNLPFEETQNRVRDAMTTAIHSAS